MSRRVSRLDSFIRRLEAQRACLDLAAALVARPRRAGAGARARQRPDLRSSARAVSRTGRSMSASARSRRIPTACRRPNCCSSATCARPCRPRAHGSPAGSRWPISTPASGDVAASRALAAELAPLIVPLLRPGAVLVSEPADGRWPSSRSLALPDGRRRRPLPPLPPHQPPIVTMTGTWSEALSQLRLSRWIRVSTRAPTSAGVTQTWSSRRPRSEAAQSRAR